MPACVRLLAFVLKLGVLLVLLAGGKRFNNWVEVYTSV